MFAEVHSVEEKMEVPVGRGSWESSLLGDPSAKFVRETSRSRKTEEMHVQGWRGELRMKGTRHSEEQIITILKQGEAGLPTTELCRQHSITEQTYYRWKAKYGGMETGDARKLKQLEDENRKLKHVVAELTLDNRALKDVLSKNF